MLTLWDLLEPLTRRLQPPQARAAITKARPAPITPPKDRIPVARPASASRPREPVSQSMQAKYDAVVRLMLETHRVRVRKWRKNMSGVAWYVTYQDGKINRLIESPRPKGPMSVAIFLHEIGHHAIGFNVYKPRCLEEYHAWRWSLEQMEAHGLNITDAVRHRMAMSLWYAVQKAQRRGIRELPAELLPYTQRPAKPTSKTAQRRGTAKPRRDGDG